MPAMEKDGESECHDQHRRESRVDVDQMHDVLLGRVNGGRQTIEMKPIEHGVNSLDEKAKTIGRVSGWVLLKGDRLRGNVSEKYAERQNQREDDRDEEHVNVIYNGKQKRNRTTNRKDTKRNETKRKKKKQSMLVFARVTCVVGEDRTEWTDAHVDQVA
jgi:hypothetical protein